jgi:hypothetical protein
VEEDKESVKPAKKQRLDGLGQYSIGDSRERIGLGIIICIYVLASSRSICKKGTKSTWSAYLSWRVRPSIHSP